MSELPIIFNTEMVKALLDGRKTQTRRHINPIPPDDIDALHAYKFTERAPYNISFAGNRIGFMHGEDEDDYTAAPYQIGDILYVRESWRTQDNLDKIKPSKISKMAPISYEASGLQVFNVPDPYDYPYGKLRPSIHMPKWAARIHLKITNVRIERVQDISEEDVKAEGVYTQQMCAGAGLTWMFKPRRQFLDVREKIYDNTNENPYVWVYDFEVMT